ncbi:MAG: EH signature domain-containing protein [Halothece sp.]
MVGFKQIVSIEPLQLKPTALTELANKIGNNTEFSPPELPQGVAQYQNLNPRSLDEIVMDLEEGNADNITLLEWVYCIYAKEEWDAEHSQEQRLATSRLVWENAIDNYTLKQRLCSRLAYYYDGNKESLARSFVETFSSLSDVLRDDDLTVSVLLQFRKRDPLLPLAQLSLSEQLTPKQLFITAQLPSNLSIINDVLEYVVTAFSQSIPQQNQANWLVKCLEDMTVDQEISAVETLLKSVSAEFGGQFQNLVQWLQNHYGSRSSSSRWNRLSSEAKSALRQWLGAANYRDFQKLVNLIASQFPDHGGKEHHEKNQLLSRKYFWEQYSDQFERIRILLPQSSVNVVGNQLLQDVDIIQNDGSDETEVCIFDFGDWFVVEFFRGGGSETRLFHRHQYPNIEQELFTSSQLSVKRLRRLGGEKHDHVYLWQIDCEKWLRNRGILPNKGTTHFKRRNKDNPDRAFLDPYNPKTGLLLHDPEGRKRQTREQKLIRWHQEIDQLEREAKAAYLR